MMIGTPAVTIGVAADLRFVHFNNAKKLLKIGVGGSNLWESASVDRVVAKRARSRN